VIRTAIPGRGTTGRRILAALTTFSVVACRALRILLVTGYTATLTAATVKTLGIRALALKPLNLETLRSVHEILSTSPDTVS